MVSVSSKKRQRGSERDRAIAGREYQVEAILDKRIRGNRTQYLLKWKNYPNEDNTWEDENRLNCPDLFREFEERSKEKTDTKRSTTRRSKNTNMQDADEDFQSIEDQSTTTENGSDSTKIDDDDDDDDKSDHHRIMTRQSPRKKARLSSPKTSSSTPSRRHSNRITINETKSRITSMSKDESSSGETTEEEVIPKKRSKKPVSVTRNTRNTSNEIPITISDDDDNNHNNNNSTDVSGRKTTTNEPTIQTRRLRVTPSTTSSISFSSNANERNSEKTSAAENCSEIVDETNQVQRIETVRYYHNEISFRIKLIHENEARWISSKIANRKYPQAVIAFWENHVEFT